MSRSIRLWLFLASAVPLVAFMVWGVAGLKPFGSYPGPYGDVINALAAPQRHIDNAATAVNFDYRGFDTLGEEFILFVSVAGLVLILRAARPEEERDRRAYAEPPRTDGLRALGLPLLPVVVIFGGYIAVHASATPGGGFQGGAIVASGLLLAFVCGSYAAFTSVGRPSLLDPLESLGAGAYVAIGLCALALGLPFLSNYLPLGQSGSLYSGGTVWYVNLAVLIEVASGFGIVTFEFLKEAEA